MRAKISQFLCSWFFFYLLGVIMALLFVWFVNFFFSGNSDNILNDIQLSPNKKFVAIAYTNMGGGAAGWCYKYVSVVPKAHFLNFDKGSNIAAGRCSSNISIEWQTNNLLTIHGIHEPFIRQGETDDKQIKIDYRPDK